ncbi:hypothetical protein DFH09DRAFT_1473835, partial [Mycena vulgaris]
PCGLARPPLSFTDIARDALLAPAPAPELSAGVPAKSIRHGLRAITTLVPSYLPTSLPRSHLPAALTVPLRAFPGAPPVSYPTHAFFPLPAVVLAVHCAKHPRLPPSAPSGLSRTASATLPSPHAFAILYAFMYTHRLAPALAALLPLLLLELTHATLLATLATLVSPPALHALGSHLCAASSSNLSALMGHAGHVKELWEDMVALSVYDPELWDAPHLA